MKRQELGVCLENSIPSFRAGGEVAGPCGGCVAAGRGDLPLDRVSWKLERQSFKERTSGGQPAASGWTTSSVSPGRKCIRGSSSPFIRRGVHGPNCQLSPTKDRCLKFPLDGAAGDRSTGCLPRHGLPGTAPWHAHQHAAQLSAFLGLRGPLFPP